MSRSRVCNKDGFKDPNNRTTSLSVIIPTGFALLLSLWFTIIIHPILFSHMILQAVKTFWSSFSVFTSRVIILDTEIVSRLFKLLSRYLMDVMVYYILECCALHCIRIFWRPAGLRIT